MLFLESKVALGIVSSILALITYIPYLIDMFKGKTKPHLYTWVIWSVVTGIGFFGSLKTGGDAGSWHIGCTAFLTTVVAIVAVRNGTKDIRIFDTFCLLLSIFAVLLWVFTNNPYWSVVMAVVIDLFAYLPTFRKSYNDPNSETLSLYFLGATKNFIGTYANTVFSVTTCLYPLAIGITNTIFIIFVIIRKRAINKEQQLKL